VELPEVGGLYHRYKRRAAKRVTLNANLLQFSGVALPRAAAMMRGSPNPTYPEPMLFEVMQM
jgi:hypothetical protein